MMNQRDIDTRISKIKEDINYIQENVRFIQLTLRNNLSLLGIDSLLLVQNLLQYQDYFLTAEDKETLDGPLTMANLAAPISYFIVSLAGAYWYATTPERALLNDCKQYLTKADRQDMTENSLAELERRVRETVDDVKNINEAQKEIHHTVRPTLYGAAAVLLGLQNPLQTGIATVGAVCLEAYEAIRERATHPRMP